MGRKKTMVRAACVCLFAAVLLCGVWYGLYQVPDSRWEIKIIYGEFHENRDGGTSQLFYAKEDEEFSEEQSLMQNVWEMDQSVTFELPELSLADMKLRLDPFMNDNVFSIYRVEVRQAGEFVASMDGKEFAGYVEQMENCGYDGRTGFYFPTSEDPVLYLNSGFNQRIMNVWRGNYLTYQSENGLMSGVLLAMYLAFVLFFWPAEKKSGVRRAKQSLWPAWAAGFLLCLGASLVYAVHFVMERFGNVRLEELFFLMNTALTGTNLSSFYGLFAAIAGIVFFVSVIAALGASRVRRTGRMRAYAVWMAGLGVLLIGTAVWTAFDFFDVASYYAYITDKSLFYEEHFVDAKDVELVFPEQKRNLIYLYLESMEMTFADKANGGAMPENYIPELTRLAQENIDFSAPDRLNGAHAVSGTTFTTGGMVAQTAGVPINTSMISNETVNGESGVGAEHLLPGAWTLGDILEQEGYRQVLLIGSDAGFGTRRQYFGEHGGYEIRDYYAARNDGQIPEDYYVWWGYEDEYLFEFAKDKLAELAKEDEPFHLTLLTVDTHFSGGYWCGLCENRYEMQYSNVIACSSMQVAYFIDWIAQQDFYENTTIIISGDHLTMDTEYTDKMLYGNQFDRRTYVSIINPAEGCVDPETERGYTTLDLYPTTLAALGVQIAGDRLGLGVNLFSGLPTLYEEYGGAYLDAELLKRSDLYAEKLVYGEELLAEDAPEENGI